MAIAYNPTMVTGGLVFMVDFANTRSYPGSGTTIFDLSGNGNNGSFVGSPTVSGGAITTSSSNGASFSTVNLSGNTQFTIIGSARYTGGGSNNRGRIINALTNNWLMGHWSNSVANYFAVGWVTASGAGGTDNTWRIYHATGNTSTGTYQLYINNSLNTSAGGGTAGPNGIALGYYGPGGSTSEPSDGNCGFVAAYNRVLTATEVAQNFNAFRGRYGL